MRNDMSKIEEEWPCIMRVPPRDTSIRLDGDPEEGLELAQAEFPQFRSFLHPSLPQLLIIQGLPNLPPEFVPSLHPRLVCQAGKGGRACRRRCWSCTWTGAAGRASSAGPTSTLPASSPPTPVWDLPWHSRPYNIEVLQRSSTRGTRALFGWSSTAPASAAVGKSYRHLPRPSWAMDALPLRGRTFSTKLAALFRSPYAITVGHCRNSEP